MEKIGFGVRNTSIQMITSENYKLTRPNSIREAASVLELLASSAHSKGSPLAAATDHEVKGGPRAKSNGP